MRWRFLGSRTTTLAVLVVLFVGACAAQAPGDPVAPAADGRLYVVNFDTASLSSFAPLDTVDGNVTPTTRIVGPSTRLPNFSPTGLHLDVANNRAYVTAINSARVVVFDNVSQATGDVGPTREISGADTQLNSPSDVSLDASRNLLYVAERSVGAIRVYGTATTINGNVAPVRVITGASTLLDTSEKNIFIDSANNRLYVSQLSNSLLVWDNASTVDGNVAPNRNITGAATTLNYSWGGWVDVGRNEWFVVNYLGNSITVFANASTATGNVAPTRTISGAATLLSNPAGVLYDSANDRLYVANWGSSAILVWNNASTANGNVAPDRVISGADTQLSEPTGLGVDRTR
jgi:hypothetical protein